MNWDTALEWPWKAVSAATFGGSVLRRMQSLNWDAAHVIVPLQVLGDGGAQEPE